MKINKLIKVMICCITMLFLISCNANKKVEEIEIDLFSVKESEKIARSYLDYIKNQDIEGANSLCYPEIVENTKDTSAGASEIESYAKEMIIEGNESANFIFNVIRKTNEEINCDLETVSINIKRENDEYKIDSIKSSTKSEVYTKGDELRIIGEDGGSSQLIIKLSSLAKDTYLSNNEIMMYKEEIPKEYFGAIGMSFDGESIAISTEDSESSYICIVNIDSSMMTSLVIQPEGEESQDSSVEDQENLEKAIAQKVISLDILDNAKVNRFNFNENQEIIEVDYVINSNIERIRLYNALEGALIETGFEEKFPEEVYNIKDGKFEGEEFTFKVESIDGSNNEIVGNYSFNIESLEIKKL